MSDELHSLSPPQPWELTQAQVRLHAAKQEVQLWARLIEQLEKDFARNRLRSVKP
jgi:hypothetical protein